MTILRQPLPHPGSVTPGNFHLPPCLPLRCLFCGGGIPGLGVGSVSGGGLAEGKQGGGQTEAGHGSLQCGWDLGASQPSERAVGSQESREAWNRRGSSRREDELLRQGGDVRKEEGQMGKLGRSREGCRQGLDLYCDAPSLPTPSPVGLRPPYSTFGGCLWLPPDCLGRGLTAEREKGDGWGSFLPVGLWKRKDKKNKELWLFGSAVRILSSS